MNIQSLLKTLQESPNYRGEIACIREEPPRAARFADPAEPLAPAISRALGTLGIERLYIHQAQAIDAVRGNSNVVVATGTASGKSLAYALPILESLLICRSNRSLLLFPTKALCQDQFRSFCRLMSATRLADVSAGVYDGDTPAALRRKLRDQASLLFTNPDMLHAALMPQHARWAAFLNRLRFLVLDELHVYNGLFGANMANLLRRFTRLCRHYGSHPQIVACSATIGNPKELAERLTEQAFELVDTDGSPRGRRTYVIWNPPRERSTARRSRRSANVDAHRLMAMLVQHNCPTITFSKARITAEMIYRYVCDTLRQAAPSLVSRVAPYRGGYRPEERRHIEQSLFNGELLGVSTTPALELGIDVGGLDASILVGYPGTLASFFQQAGRAGRRERDSLVILIALDTATNQYIVSHPEYLFDRPVEQAVVDADNPFVVMGHLRCAAHELPLSSEDIARFGPNAALAARILQENGKLRHLDGRWYHAASETPHHELPLRSLGEANIIVQDAQSGEALEEVTRLDGPPLLHPDAIYLHHGETYRVLELNLQKNLATVQRVDVDYYTQAFGGCNVHHIDHRLREKPFGAGIAAWGEVTALFRTDGFEKVRFYELDAFSQHGLRLPPMVLETTAVWITPPEALIRRVMAAGLDAHAGLRGIGYATRMALPLFITCDTLDFSHTVGCTNSPWHTVFIFERYPHGLGFMHKAYERLHEILPSVLDAIRRCQCADGCPCCVGKPLRQTSTWNVERGEGAIPSKTAAVMILEAVLAEHARLNEPDTFSLTDSDAAHAARLEQALRRRLEVQRQPILSHPINPMPPTQYPAIEPAETLSSPDATERLRRTGSLSRKIRKRTAAGLPHALLDTRPPPAAHIDPPTDSAKSARRPTRLFSNGGQRTESDCVDLSQTAPSQPTEQPIHVGHPLAARARELLRHRSPQTKKQHP